MMTVRRDISKFLALTLLGAVLVSAVPARAQTPFKAPVVAILDMRDIMRDSVAGRAMQDYFNSRRKILKDQIAGEEKNMRAAFEELNRQRSILAPQAFQARERAFREQENAARGRVAKLEQDHNRDLRGVQVEVNKLVHDKLQGIFQQMINEKGIDLVLANEAVVVSRKEMDITGEVLKRLNAALPKVDVRALAAKAKKAKK